MPVPQVGRGGSRADEVRSEPWDHLSVCWWRLREMPRNHLTAAFVCENVRTAESVSNGLRAENIHLTFEMYEITRLVDLRLLWLCI